MPAREDVRRGLVVWWLIFYAVAAIISAIALFLEVKEFIALMRERRSELAIPDNRANTTRTAKMQKHHMRFVETRRTIRMTYISIMLGLGECFPLGILQGTSAM